MNFIIDEISANPPDMHLRVEIPARLVKRYQKKLKKAGHKLSSLETLQTLTQYTLSHTISRLELNPIFGPSLVEEAREPLIQEGKPFTLEMHVDHWQEIDDIDFRKFKVQRPVQEITDVMIETEMQEQQRMAGGRVTVEGPIVPFDEIACGIRVLDGESGNQLEHIRNSLLRIPEQGDSIVIAGCQIDGVPESLIGSSTGNAVIWETTLPMQWPIAEVRGKHVSFELIIKSITHINPATVEEVVEQYGSPNELILRNQISSSLEQRIAEDQLNIMQDQILREVADLIQPIIPQRVVVNATKSAQNILRQKLSSSISDEAVVEKQVNEAFDICELKGIDSARLTVAAQQLLKKLKIQPGEKEIIARIATESAKRGIRPDEYQKELVENDQMKGILARTGMSMLVDLLIEKCDIQDIPLEEWNAKNKSTV